MKTGLFPFSPPASVPTLPYRLIQDDGSRDRNIKTSDMAEHRYADDLIAPFPHEPSKPVTLSSYDDGCWKGEIPFIVGHFRVSVESYRPDPRFFQVFQRPRRIKRRSARTASDARRDSRSKTGAARAVAASSTGLDHACPRGTDPAGHPVYRAS